MSFREMHCVTCGQREYVVRYEARLPDLERLDFSARRAGEHCHPRIVECAHCGQIYSNPYFGDGLIADLYRSAKYIDEPQLDNMARDYLREFEAAVGDRPKDGLRVLEVGCANGFFLRRLHQQGYRSLQGIEPGQEAVALAPQEVRPFIRNDFFGPASFPPSSFDVVCCFQVMDHMIDPAAFVQAVFRVLDTGGLFLAVNHDIRSAMTRFLGERSPMYDVEHIFLFDRSTISRLLASNGFEVVECRSLYNSYTFDYALKMFPLPRFLKGPVGALLGATGLGSMSVRVPAGNIVTVARRMGQ
jgi:SAM-dependent methyltransferase